MSAGASGNRLGVGYLSRDARLGDIDYGNQADSGIFGLPGELTLGLGAWVLWLCAQGDTMRI